jgi:predicted Zn-dependent peptidase
MAYYVSSALDASVVEGPLFIRAGVNPANVDRTIASIDAELDRARSEGFTQKELDDSRQYLIGSMPRALETNSGIATFLQTQEFFGLGEDYDVRLPRLLDDVSLDAVNARAGCWILSARPSSSPARTKRRVIWALSPSAARLVRWRDMVSTTLSRCGPVAPTRTRPSP